jgi:hypothetical protein
MATQKLCPAQHPPRRGSLVKFHKMTIAARNRARVLEYKVGDRSVLISFIALSPLCDRIYLTVFFPSYFAISFFLLSPHTPFLFLLRRGNSFRLLIHTNGVAQRASNAKLYSAFARQRRRRWHFAVQITLHIARNL